MMKRLPVAALFVSVISSAIAAQAPLPGRRPEVPKSIANVKPSNVRNGPLFQLAKSAFLSTKDPNGNFRRFLTRNARLEISTYAFPQPPKHDPIDEQFISALLESCDGPLSYDEGEDWVELNWVCSVDPSASIAKHYIFRESPEIVMLISFDGKSIKKIDAIEPMWIPGTQRLAMNAYAVAHGHN